MIRLTDLIKPNSGKSSTRFAGLTSLFSLVGMAITVLIMSCFYEIPKNNAELLGDIAYTLGAVAIGVFVKTAFEKKPIKIEE
jgi:hypothetical protein